MRSTSNGKPRPHATTAYAIVNSITSIRERELCIKLSVLRAQYCRSYGTLPTPVKSSTPVYCNNPGKIENFTPGHSSVSDKERKEVNTNFSFQMVVANVQMRRDSVFLKCFALSGFFLPICIRVNAIALL